MSKNKTKTNKDPRGGIRKGAGRPKTGKAKQWVVIQIQKETKEKLILIKNNKNLKSLDSVLLALISNQ